VLPVYIRSNIDQVWVVGAPDSTKRRGSTRKIEVPLPQFEFAGNRRNAIRLAEEFSEFAAIYAENLQDGLPVRENPDNNSRRVYRLRVGEIIKVLDKVEGSPPISASGEPLPGNWYRVLTNGGVTGFCFSYRLKMFSHHYGPLQAAPEARAETLPDPDLDMIMSRTWSAEIYQQMINSRRINIREFERNYRFDPGQDTGIAKIVLPDMEMEFKYNSIYPEGERSWRFEGANLQMTLRSNTTLAVQFLENTGLRRTLIFVALSSDIDDIITQENNRREALFMTIYNQGPVFTSNNFGTIIFTETGGFSWTGFNLLVPQIIPENTIGEGRVLMDLFITQSFTERYNGAFTLRFTETRPNLNLRFMYNLDNQGLRMEVVPDYAVENITVTRRAPSPMVLYFFRDTMF
jgi:hypothetical protein